MTKFIAILKVLIQLYPMVVEIIEVVEKQFPEGGKGAEKLAIVKQLIAAAYEASDDIEDAFDKVWPAIKRMIDTIVETYNSLGIFKKS